MEWAEVDLDNAEWNLPAGRTKNKRAHVVPLTETAITVLRGQEKVGSFVFSTTGRTPVSGLSKAKAQLDAAILAARRNSLVKAGADPSEATPIAHWTFHDLRRTATTGMAKLGVPPHVGTPCPGHPDRLTDLP